MKKVSKLVLITAPLLQFLLPIYLKSQTVSLEMNAGIVLGNEDSESPAPGTIRWNGSDFEGWNGAIWVSLTGNQSSSTVTDIDGNQYKTLRYGHTEWMIENLRVTRYNDSTTISHAATNAQWILGSGGKWCWYDNEDTFDNSFGKLYNWEAVNSEKLCPIGWDEPFDADYTQLIQSIGGNETVVGTKLKSTGTEYWEELFIQGTNASGFSGHGGGYREVDGTFVDIRKRGEWWTANSTSTTTATAFRLSDVTSDYSLVTGTPINRGLSVRCVRYID